MSESRVVRMPGLQNSAREQDPVFGAFFSAGHCWSCLSGRWQPELARGTVQRDPSDYDAIASGTQELTESYCFLGDKASATAQAAATMPDFQGRCCTRATALRPARHLIIAAETSRAARPSGKTRIVHTRDLPPGGDLHMGQTACGR